MKEVNVSLLGSTGVTGIRALEILNGHPFLKVNELYASNRTEGIYLSEVPHLQESNLNREILEKKVKAIDSKVIYDKSDLFLSFLPTNQAQIYEDLLRRNGKKVITNSAAFRMDRQVPIVIPEINYDHLGLLRDGGGIIANGNCTTIGLALALTPISKFGLKRVFVTTSQSVSGAGYSGVTSMDIMGNIIPFIANEEGKIVEETQKIFGNLHDNVIKPDDLEIHPTAMRVPTIEGHLGSVTVEIKEAAPIEEIEKSISGMSRPEFLKNLPTAPEFPVILRREQDRPQILRDIFAGSPKSAKGMSISVGRVRKAGKFISLVYVVNNLVRGASGSTVLNAELLTKDGVLEL